MMTDIEEYSQEFVEIAMRTHAEGRFVDADAFRDFVVQLAEDVQFGLIGSDTGGADLEVLGRMIITARSALLREGPLQHISG